MFDFLVGLGAIGIVLLCVVLFVVPIIITVIVGVALANLLGFTGIVWWSFVILFYIVVMGLLGVLTK